MWVFPKIMVPPKSSILIGFSIINHPFWGTPIFGNTYVFTGVIKRLPGMFGPLRFQGGCFRNFRRPSDICFHLDRKIYLCLGIGIWTKATSRWPTHLKNISQIGSFPQVGVKIKNVWNHHLVQDVWVVCCCLLKMWKILEYFGMSDVIQYIFVITSDQMHVPSTCIPESYHPGSSWNNRDQRLFRSQICWFD